MLDVVFIYKVCYNSTRFPSKYLSESRTGRIFELGIPQNEVAVIMIDNGGDSSVWVIFDKIWSFLLVLVKI